MMSDQAHALFLAVRDQHIDVEIFGRLGKVHVITVAEPIAIPAYIPAFDQQMGILLAAAKSM